MKFIFFEDSNRNDARDLGERPLSHIRLRNLNSGRDYISDEKGVVEIFPLPTYETLRFEIVMESISNVTQRPVTEKFNLMLAAGQTIEQLVPVRESYDLQGRMAENSCAKLIPLVLTSNSTPRSWSTMTSLQGDFDFSDIPSGTYSLRVDEKFLTERKIHTNPATLNFQISEDSAPTDLLFQLTCPNPE